MKLLRKEQLLLHSVKQQQTGTATEVPEPGTISQLCPVIPEPLRGLLDLALDLRFCWSHEAAYLWKQLNPELWSLTHNPWLILQTVSEAKFKQLVMDDVFCARVQAIVDDDRKSRRRPRWFKSTQSKSALTTIAYFSLEFGLSESLPIYSGGLGNVAGDQLKAADDLDLPMVGVGILYQNGYFRQFLAPDGSQVALYPSNNTGEMPILPVRTRTGDWFRFPLDIPGHGLWVRVWEARIGKVKLYLLDTNDPANLPVDRCITGELYGGGPEQRLMQEILLGIGGYRMLRALGICPEVCHLNEGHAAFVVLERARSFMEEQQVSFWPALATTRMGNLFTTHTPVEAGFDRFEPKLINKYLGGYAHALGITVDELLSLGRRVRNDPIKPFNMAYLGIRGSGAVNGVSQLHGEVSRRLFAPLFPDWPVSQIPIGHVTNGVHVPSWCSKASEKLWKAVCGPDPWSKSGETIERKFRDVPDETLWELRNNNRSRLVSCARAYYARQLAANTNRSMQEVREEAQLLFDPNALTLGFARRFATYKRPEILLTDPERFARILTNCDFPVQIVIAGKAHPQDHAGQAIVKAWVQFMKRSDVRRHAIFIGDYDMLLAERLVQGVDVWLNTPRRPWEASGTSGMKILVNGGLNLSELDGWWAEAHNDMVGWSLGDGEEYGFDPARDRAQAEALYSLLEERVVPEFYQRNGQGIPGAWVRRIRESMARLTPQYSTTRVVKEYTEKYYLTCAENYLERATQGARKGKELCDWNSKLSLHWPKCRFGELNVDTGPESYRFRVPVYLGDLKPNEVSVEVYADPDGDGRTFCLPMDQSHMLSGSTNGYLYSGQVPANRPLDHYTVRIIPNHANTSVPLEAGHILWCRQQALSLSINDAFG